MSAVREVGVGVVAALATCLAMLACKQEPPERVLQAYPERYAGVGIELADEVPHPTVRRVFAGTSAEVAGLRVGDALLEIDGVELKGRALADVVAGLRGEIGSRVLVTVRRVSGGREVVALVRGGFARAASRDYAPAK